MSRRRRDRRKLGTILPPSIPSEEEFAKASAAMAADFALYAELRRHLLKNFLKLAPLHDIHFFGSLGSRLEAYFFYEKLADISKFHANGLEQAMRESLLNKINAFSETSGHASKIEFHFLSYEEVQKKCNGDYYRFFR